MAFKQFCSPHVHVSSLDSASTPAAFVKRELELGSKTLTTTDHGSLVACRQVYKLAKKAGLIPVIGVEGYFQDYSCEKAQRSKYYHVTIHCPTQHCFEVVTKRISRADVERGQQAGSERKPIFTWEDLEEIAAAGATFGSGCLVGMVQRHLADSDDPEMAQKYFERLMGMAPGRFFVEVFPHRTDRNWMSGVRVVKEGGGNVDYRSKKKLRLDGGEIHVDDLPKLFSKNPQQYGKIRAVMENRKWVELAEPIVVQSASAVDDYVKNDCSPWAPDGDSQEGANRFVLEMAKRHKIPVLVSDDSHFTHPEDKVVQDVRLGAGSNGAWRMYSSYHRMSSDEAFAHFQASLGTTEKEFEGWVDNSLAWAEMFKGFSLKSQPQLPTNFYPGDPIERLFTLIAAEGRFDPDDQRQVERLTKELGILHSNGKIDLIPYFFVTQEVVKLYEAHGKLTGPGRGSAAGLLTAYLLGITHVDPIRFNLSTERFITKERILSGKMPDIDQDLPDRDLLEGVGEESGWLQQRFGRNVAQIGALTSMKLRSSIKDVCRVMFPGGVPAEVEELTSRMLKPPQGVDDAKFVFGYVDDEDVKHDGSITYDTALIEFAQKYPAPWAVAQKCLGLTRQRTRHPCGFAIAGREIDDLVPLTVVGKEKSVTTSFPADGCEDAGIIKYDFLTVNSVRDIDQCLKLIRARTPEWESMPGIRGVRSVPFCGRLHDVWDLPNDPVVLRELAAGHTETVFQLCTPSAKKWLKAFNHNKPDGSPVLGSVEAMAAFVALDRPGPLNAELMSPDGGNHNMMVEYCRRARGQQGSPDINDKFEKLFPETYSLPVYQEQIEKLTQEMAGISASEAVELRGLLAKKKKDEVEKWRPRFVQGATKVLGSEEEASKLWALVYNYAQYSFNKSVAAGTILESCNSGRKAIEHFLPGDEIRGVDSYGTVITTQVVGLHDHGELEAYEVMFDDGFVVVTSARHKFLTLSGQTPLHEIVVRGLEVLADAGKQRRLEDEVWCGCSEQSDAASTSEGVFPLSQCEASWGTKTPGTRCQMWGGDLADTGRCPTSKALSQVSCNALTSGEQSRMECALWSSVFESDLAKRSSTHLRGLSSDQKEEHPGEDDSYLEDAGSEGGMFSDRKTNLCASGDTAATRGASECVEREESRTPQEYDQKSSESRQTEQGGSMAQEQWSSDVAGGPGELRHRPEAGGFCFKEGLGRGGRLLPLLRGFAEKASSVACSRAGSAPEQRSVTSRCDIDPTVWRLFLQLGRTHEGGLAELVPSDAPLSSTGDLVLRSVVRVRSVGIRRMYDLEVAHERHNFLLPNGVVTSNSHSMCYAVIAYACGWLKHHFPLEWWCAVLQNAKKDEVEETFWQHCGKLVDPPDVNLSGANYEIQGDRIRAPISLINGVGEKAQSQLEAGRPYVDVRDFVVKQRDWQRRNAKKDKLATSALHRGVVGKMICSGVMDPLFPAGTTLLDQLDTYEQVLSEVTGCKRESVDKRYAELSEIQRYQMRKSVLPAYSAPIAKMVGASECDRVRSETGTEINVVHGTRTHVVMDGERMVVPNYDELQFLNQFEPLSTELSVGVVAYVTSARAFSWDGRVSVEYVLEVEGGRFRAVWWPRKNRKARDLGTGSVVAGRLSRSRSGHGFSIDYLVCLSPPL